MKNGDQPCGPSEKSLTNTIPNGVSSEMSLHATKRENTVKNQKKYFPRYLLNFNAIVPVKNKPAPQLNSFSTSTYLGDHSSNKP